MKSGSGRETAEDRTACLLLSKAIARMESIPRAKRQCSLKQSYLVAKTNLINENLLMQPESAKEMEEGEREREMKVSGNLVHFCFPYFTFSTLAGKYKEVQK